MTMTSAPGPCLSGVCGTDGSVAATPDTAGVPERTTGVAGAGAAGDGSVPATVAAVDETAADPLTGNPDQGDSAARISSA
ncbi:MAG TPA: hypothetical protein VLT47_15015, partial [Anaeromyxobacteraceae bacterium]|nr:hypothetical protein [Anaeromyxobacteraceae bacterium]